MFSICGFYVQAHSPKRQPSEPSSQGEKDLAVAGVADGDAEGEQTDGRAGYQTYEAVLTENRFCLRRPDLAGLVAEDAIEALSDAGGQSRNPAHVTGAGQVCVGAPELIEG